MIHRSGEHLLGRPVHPGCDDDVSLLALGQLIPTFTLVGTVVAEDALDSESLLLSPLLLLLLELSWLTPLPSAEING